LVLWSDLFRQKDWLCGQGVMWMFLSTQSHR
jgi:hypothetical protein